jgi:hypothetical protein
LKRLGAINHPDSATHEREPTMAIDLAAAADPWGGGGRVSRDPRAERYPLGGLCFFAAAHGLRHQLKQGDQKGP